MEPTGYANFPRPADTTRLHQFSLQYIWMIGLSQFWLSIIGVEAQKRK